MVADFDLAPSEHSSADWIRRGGITKIGKSQSPSLVLAGRCSGIHAGWATGVQIGTANFVNPRASQDVVESIAAYAANK